MNSKKTLKNDENTKKEHKLSGYHGIGHLCKGIIPTTRLPEIEKLYSKMSDFLGSPQAFERIFQHCKSWMNHG